MIPLSGKTYTSPEKRFHRCDPPFLKGGLGGPGLHLEEGTPWRDYSFVLVRSLIDSVPARVASQMVKAAGKLNSLRPLAKFHWNRETARVVHPHGVASLIRSAIRRPSTTAGDENVLATPPHTQLSGPRMRNNGGL